MRLKASFGILLHLAAMLWPAPLWARFVASDADEVDDETKLSLEAICDAISYRYPVLAQRQWDLSRNGFRANAGSLNMKRFLYSDDIKLQTDPAAEITLGYLATRREDRLLMERLQELQVMWRPLTLWRFGILGDGGSEKAIADVGLLTGLFVTPRQYVDFYYWSVDHYYDSKKEEDDNSRDDPTWTAGARFLWDTGTFGVYAGTYEWDDPLRWQRSSKGYIYSYENKYAHLQAQLPVGDEHEVWLRLEHQDKREGKTWISKTDASDILYSKRLKRSQSMADTSLVHSKENRVWQTGTAFFWRKADYEGRAGSVSDETQWEEKNTPDTLRQEASLYSTYHFPLSASLKPYLQLGFIMDPVRVQEGDETYRLLDTKIQTAWHYYVAEKSFILLSATWDIDEMVRTYPYKEEPFKPWGGGNIQFQVVF